MKIFITILFLLMIKQTQAQNIDTVFLERLMASKPTLFDPILKTVGNYQVQILYTQINRDKDNHPQFKSFSYHLNPQHYFYPASTVKLAAVIFALEKVNRLKKTGLTANSTMITDSAFNGQTKVLTDSTAENKLPSIAHYIKKILLTSDNDAFNRLFEFIGRAEINAKLKQNGLNHSRILNRLAIGDAGESTKHSNPIRFFNGKKLVYAQAAAYDAKDYPLNLDNILVGKGYIDTAGKLVNKPFNFSGKNVFAINDQQKLMMKLIFPEAFPVKERYNLTEADYKLIYSYMSRYPTESKFPNYNPNSFWPTYAKMLYYGREKIEPEPNIRIFNKYGDSYGFIIDNSYFVDFKNGVEFFLTAVVQGNEDGIYNDEKYDYETICYPFMKNLGKSIYAFELSRKKVNLPNLKKFKFDYQP